MLYTLLFSVVNQNQVELFFNSAECCIMNIGFMQIVHIEDICARKAIYSKNHIDLSEKMRSALKCIGVSKFYSHQVQKECVLFSN